MSKITLNNVADLTQTTTAASVINANSATVQAAFDNTLSRDGTAPNQMQSTLDMNGNQIINLPTPTSVNSPARLIDVVTNPTISVPPVGTSGAVVGLLNGNNTYSGTSTFTGIPTGPTASAGTNNTQLATTAFVVSSLGTPPVLPQGRLTLLSGVPVQNADSGAVTTIYYAPYIGIYIPVYNGTLIQFKQFTASANDSVGLSLPMAGSSTWTANTLYDVFYASVAGVFYFGTGPAWTNSTAGSSTRGTGAGTTQLQMFNGIQTNQNTMTLTYGPASTISVPVNQATYLGTFYTSAAGTTRADFRPTAVSGGTNNLIGYQNFYNKVPYFAKCQDSTSTWTYTPATVRDVNGSANNRIRFVDCVGNTPAYALYTVSMTVGSGIAAATVGIGFNQDCTSISNFSGGAGNGARLGQAGVSGSNQGQMFFGAFGGMSASGFNFAQAGEGSGGTLTTYFGNDFMMLSVEGQF